MSVLVAFKSVKDDKLPSLSQNKEHVQHMQELVKLDHQGMTGTFGCNRGIIY